MLYMTLLIFLKELSFQLKVEKLKDSKDKKTFVMNDDCKSSIFLNPS